MRARRCGHLECQRRLEHALTRRKREMELPAQPGEEMATVHSSHGEFRIPKRLADAEIALDLVTRCAR